jgi:hypothetical protein
MRKRGHLAFGTMVLLGALVACAKKARLAPAELGGRSSEENYSRAVVLLFGFLVLALEA